MVLPQITYWTAGLQIALRSSCAANISTNFKIMTYNISAYNIYYAVRQTVSYSQADVVQISA